MSLHLITGYAGHEHITSADQGAYNAATFGSGQFVLDRGNKFTATAISNNIVKIADGEAMMKGRFIKLASGTTENVTIENGSQSKYRNDLIVIRYEKSSLDSTESASFKVIKGTESTTTATDPSYTNGNITDGTDLINDMPLYRVSLNGINIESITPLFSIKTSMVDYMSNYQLPVASSTTLGGIKVGEGFNIIDGVLSNKYTSYSHQVYSKSKTTIATKSATYVEFTKNYYCHLWNFAFDSEYSPGKLIPIPRCVFFPYGDVKNATAIVGGIILFNTSESSITINANQSLGCLYTLE